MAIDDPLDASEKQLAAEERASSPLARFIPNLVQLGQVFPSMIVPFADVTKTALAAVNVWISKTAADRRDYLVTTLGHELRRMRDRLEALDESHQQFIKDEFFALGGGWSSESGTDSQQATHPANRGDLGTRPGPRTISVSRYD